MAAFVMGKESPAIADATKSVLAFITNDNSSPVPVTGSVTGNVTGQVSIVGTPTVAAQQSGPWNVGIAGTPSVTVQNPVNSVTVNNPANSPIPVTLTSSAPEQIVRLHDSGAGPFWPNTNLLYTVPKGKRLMIKFVSAQAIIDNGKMRVVVNVDALQNGFFEHYIPLSDQGQFGLSYFVAAEQVTIVAEAGENVSWTCFPSDPNKQGDCKVLVVGTLVDVQ
jgi:hypothetical protein